MFTNNHRIVIIFYKITDMHTSKRYMGALSTLMRWIDITSRKLTDIHNFTRQAERNTGAIFTNTHTHKKDISFRNISDINYTNRQA